MQNTDIKTQNGGKKIKLLLWILIPVLLVSGSVVITKSYRQKLSIQYLEKGNIALESKKYNLAELQFEKALMLNPKNQKAQLQTTLVKEAKIDVTVLKAFYEERGNTEQIGMIALTEEVPQYETEALKRAKSFIEKGEYQYAAIVARTATEMAPDYAEAKTYLEYANQHIASAM